MSKWIILDERQCPLCQAPVRVYMMPNGRRVKRTPFGHMDNCPKNTMYRKEW